MARPGDVEPIRIEFGEWLPDLPAHSNPGAILAKNCVPELTSYRSLNGLQPFADALDGEARGSFWIRSPTGSIFNFVGTPDKLQLFDGIDAYADVSGGAYSASFWDFTNFQERVVATDGATAIQYFDLGTSSAFDDLPGSPPIGQCLGVVRDFLMIGDYETSGGEREAGGFAWSGFNNTGLWTPSLSTQSGRRRNRGSGGQVQRIVSGTRGVALRQDDISSITYVGPPNVFQFDDITVLHGTDAKRSVCWTKDAIFYHSNEGFKRLNRQTLAIEDIGSFKVDRWFFENAAPTEVVNMYGSIDRRNKLVIWAFKSSGSAVTYNRLLIYNWSSKRWAYAEMNVELIGEFASVGYNLDTIGAVLGGNIDSASIPVDSEAYSGGGLALLGFNSSHEASTFDGEPLTAEIDTKEIEIPDRRMFVNGVRPIIDASTSPTIEIAPVTRNLSDATPSVGSFKARNMRTGKVDMRVDARYHRYRTKIAGGFTHAKEVNLTPQARGSR